MQILRTLKASVFSYEKTGARGLFVSLVVFGAADLAVADLTLTSDLGKIV